LSARTGTPLHQQPLPAPHTSGTGGPPRSLVLTRC